ncbi:unnamed protein product [Rotaria socialis]|uniref:G-protein coupled receptors family 1 profile domain-containing protein n=1 Tax=Rotaria socialis TaxID=392032 RepID=A0A818FPI4_9BILA|nr:unnamed protein product [Rotaria socialis]CAF4248818.1 unnamed protein product [Rotaria socialis]
MSNTTTLQFITRLFNYTLSIPMIVFGIIGAILTVIIFTKQRSFWLHPSINYLLAGAIMTGIHLPSIYLQSILVNGFGLGLFNTNMIACREHNFLLYMTTVAAISFPCWAAFDQYACTCHSASFRLRWRSLKFIRITIIGTILFWIIVYLPIIFVSDIINGLCILGPSYYTTFNTFVLTPFVYSIGPIFVITFFTLGTVKNLRNAAAHKRQGRLTKQVRRMLIPQLIVLVVAGAPFGFEGIYLNLTSNIEKSIFRLGLENVFSQLILLLFHCNYVCTFYIYWYMSSEVRKSTQQLFCKRLTLNSIGTIDTINANTMALRARNSENCSGDA